MSLFKISVHAHKGKVMSSGPSARCSQALGKIKPATSFLPHLRNASAYLHVSCGWFKAGAGKEIEGLKLKAISTKNFWIRCTPRKKGGISGLEKGLMVSCVLTMKTKLHRPALEKGRMKCRLFSAFPSHSQSWEKCRNRKVGNRNIQV